jgi:hypothetical protein
VTSKEVPKDGANMASNREEIIEDFHEQIRKSGGAAGDWLIGTAKDSRSPFFRNHLVADLDDGMIYREAFTTTAAEAIRDHFVNLCGLQSDEAGASPNAVHLAGIFRSTDAKRLGLR